MTLDVTANTAASAVAVSTDPIETFYERHPYPPPVDDVGGTTRSPEVLRAAHHLIWPSRPVASVHSVLVAGCGTAQAVRHALRHPDSRVVGIDVAEVSIEHTRALADRSGVTNLELHHLPIEAVGELGEQFDHIVCTGVLHHLADPTIGLRSLRGVLAPGGAITLMVYARYGRTGVTIFQEYCRRLGVGTAPDELTDLVDTLREIPIGHPLGRLLRESRDFVDDDALADALLNPRERAYSVPEFLDLIDGAGLRFGRWERQAAYLPDCGSISETPHSERIAKLPIAEQYALAELFRGTIVRHTAVVFGDDDSDSGVLDFASAEAVGWVPVPEPTALAVEERLPPGAAAVLLNRAHSETDLVLFVDQQQFDLFRSIDGTRKVAELGEGALELVEKLWRHDLVAIDATRGGG